MMGFEAARRPLSKRRRGFSIVVVVADEYDIVQSKRSKGEIELSSDYEDN